MSSSHSLKERMLQLKTSVRNYDRYDIANQPMKINLQGRTHPTVQDLLDLHFSKEVVESDCVRYIRCTNLLAWPPIYTSSCHRCKKETKKSKVKIITKKPVMISLNIWKDEVS